jgi:hypothetical protein
VLAGRAGLCIPSLIIPGTSSCNKGVRGPPRASVVHLRVIRSGYRAKGRLGDARDVGQTDGDIFHPCKTQQAKVSVRDACDYECDVTSLPVQTSIWRSLAPCSTVFLHILHKWYRFMGKGGPFMLAAVAWLTLWKTENKKPNIRGSVVHGERWYGGTLNTEKPPDKTPLQQLQRTRRSYSWLNFHEHNGGLYNLYSSPDIIRQIKSRGIRWAGHVARMGEERRVYKVLVGKSDGKRPPLGAPRRRWDHNASLGDLRGSVEWIHLAQCRDRWRAVVNAVMNLRVVAPPR